MREVSAMGECISVAEIRRSVEQANGEHGNAGMGRLHAVWKGMKEFIWGLAFLDIYRETLREKRKYEDLLNIVLLGEFLGLPLMNSTITLKLLPHLFPDLKHWRRRQLTEQDITDKLPDAHLH